VAGVGVWWRLGDSGSVHEAVLVGGSVEVGDVLFGEDDGESGVHGWTSFRGGARTVLCTGCSRVADRLTPPQGIAIGAARRCAVGCRRRDRYGHEGVCVSGSWVLCR
jgi:hypothetical protein